MAPRARASTAKTAPEPDAPAKRAATTKKTTATAATSAATATATRKASAATKKRKAESEPESESEPEASAPKTKKPRAAAAAAAPTTKTDPSPKTVKPNPKPNPKPKPKPKPKAAHKPKLAASRAKKPAAAAQSPPSDADATEPEGDAAQDESAAAITNGVAEHKPVRKPFAPAPGPAIRPTYPKALGNAINDVPTQRLGVYVFGEGGSCELGLGSKIVDGKRPIDVRRPRLNQLLDASSVGVVQIGVGGMHCAVVTGDNKILTWGVNDHGALGRDTELIKGDDDDSDDDEAESGLSPIESTPAEVSSEYFTPGTRFVQVACSDNATFALTEDGRVYGWGTFRGDEGILGFSESAQIQWRPTYLPSLKNIRAIATGSNHVLALDHRGSIFAWGCGQQSQLGRRILVRFKKAGLTPVAVSLPRGSKISKIACGSYHSFAIDANGRVFSWGLNNFGNTGIFEGAGDDEATILHPTLINALGRWSIADVAGGEHHSVACTTDGKVLTWGRSDGAQSGIPHSDLNASNAVIDSNGKPRIVKVPSPLPQLSNAASVTAGTDHNLAVTDDGKVYSWGFSANYQTGQGITEDVTVPTLIDNTAVRGRRIVFAGAGGQFSVLAGVPP